MALVSMAKTPAEIKEETAEASAPIGDYPQDKYPYGLCISLCEDELEKLGIPGLPAVGSTMQLMARVEVTRTSQDETDQGTRQSMSLQITDMALSEPQAAERPARSSGEIAGALFGT